MNDEWKTKFMAVIKERFHYSDISMDVITKLLLDLEEEGLITEDDIYKGGMDLFKMYVREGG